MIMRAPGRQQNLPTQSGKPRVPVRCPVVWRFASRWSSNACLGGLSIRGTTEWWSMGAPFWTSQGLEPPEQRTKHKAESPTWRIKTAICRFAVTANRRLLAANTPVYRAVIFLKIAR
jgi:hypothetical protein